MIKKISKQIIMFGVLMLILFLGFTWTKNLIIDSKLSVIEERYEREFVTDKEFLVTYNFAPIIDKYGVGEDYLVEFELKAEKEGPIYVHFSNGGGSKYSFLHAIDATTEYKKYSFIIRPKYDDENIIDACLAFWGEYGTGVIPSVKHIKFDVIEKGNVSNEES